MNYRLTLAVLGLLFVFLGLALLLPVPVSLYYGDGAWEAFAIPGAAAIILGAAAYLSLRSEEEMTIREGFGVVTFGWLWYSLIGAAPYVISGAIPGYVAAVFETMSGFTTTGATVIDDIPAIQKSVLFWRSMTQWVGGMGIIVLSLAILPYLGIAGMQLYSAEVPGPNKDKLSSRIQDTAAALWGVYFVLTAVLVFLLVMGGVPVFEAVCHAFTTMATGGFSTWNESVGHYGPYVQWVIIVFMLLAGLNFSLQYRAVTTGLSALKSDETVWYAAIYGISAVLVVASVYHLYPDAETAVRSALFQTVSIATTTGYGTSDYEKWPVFSQYLLFLLMFVGGMAGSTAGGLKIVRVIVLIKQSFVQVFRLIHPKGVKYMMLDHRAVPLHVIQGVLGFFVLNMLIIAVASLLMTLAGMDFLSGSSAVVTSLMNVGPGFGTVGPTKTFSHVTDFGKAVLTFCMLVGRLEIFTVFALLIPSFWKK